MSKQFVKLVGTLLTGVLISSLSGSCSSDEKPLFHLSTISPNKIYEVVLDEQAVFSSDPLFTKHEHHEVRFKVVRGGQTTIEHELIYSGGSYDERFASLFPRSEWLAESVLHFGRPVGANSDEVTVYNETSGVVNYVVVKCGKYEVFLLLDLPSKSVVKLFAEPQTDQHNDISYISVMGRLGGALQPSETGKNFSVHGKYQGPAHYEVHIKDKFVEITSREFEST